MNDERKQRALYRLTLLMWLLLLSPASAQSPSTRIYIANDDHTDLMWSADVDTYSRAFVEMLDWHMKLCDKTGPNPSPYRNRFNCDGSYWLWCYEQAKTPAEFAALIGKIKEGSISAPLNTVVSCYGGQPLEAVLRGMYYAGRLERQHQLRFPLAVAMENQTLPLGLASLFAGSGAKYSWRGVCGCATKMDLKALTARPREIYWWTGSDGQKILMKWHSLVPPGNQRIGGYSEAFDPAAAIQFLDSDRDFLARYRKSNTTEAYRVRGAFGFGWDALDRKTGQAYLPDPKNYPKVDHFHEIAMKLSTPQRQVIVSNEIDFFEDFEREYGESLDRLSVTYGNEWDLYSASMSETTARVKRAVEKLRTAELLSALISLREPDFMKSRTEARHRAFIHLGLFWEHNWTADGPISRAQRAAWQESLANQIESYVESLQRDAMQRLGESIALPEGARRFFVLNPLGWRRSDVVDLAYPGPADVHVHDLSSGRDVPCQWIENSGGPRLRILAQDMPSAGYKVFEIRQGKGNAAIEEAAIVGGPKNNVLESPFLQLTIAEDGAIRSFIDKENRNRELAAKVNGLWINDFSIDSDHGEPLRVVHRGPVSVTVLARSRAPFLTPLPSLFTVTRSESISRM